MCLSIQRYNVRCIKIIITVCESFIQLQNLKTHGGGGGASLEPVGDDNKASSYDGGAT